MSTIVCPNTSCGATLEGQDLKHCPRCGGFLPLPDKSDAADPLLGQPIMAGKYRILSIIGEGGMGKVYLAEQKVGSGTRKVAIKTLQPDLAMDPQIIARFDREARTVMELEHPNTIKFYDFDKLDDGKTLFVVMEFIQGESLAHVLSRGPLEAPRAERIMAQVCGSLAEAHEKGIVHRDLKPENIYLTQRGARGDFVKVLDFGIAKRNEGVDEKEAKLTRQGMVLGTPPYMSPEQFTGQTLDPRSDVYALGIIAYEMLVGALPFTGNTPWEWATKHLTAQPIPFEQQPNGMRATPKHQAAILKALKKNRDERQASVIAFLQEFTGDSNAAVDWTASSTSLTNSGSSAQNAPQAFPPAGPTAGGLPPTGPFGGFGNAPPTGPGIPPTGPFGMPPSNPGMAGAPPGAPIHPANTPNPFAAPSMVGAPPTSGGYTPAPSNAGFAAVPPAAPPGSVGSNPGFPGPSSPSMHNPYGPPSNGGMSNPGMMSAPGATAYPVQKSKSGLIAGLVVLALLVSAGIGVGVWFTSEDDDDSTGNITHNTNPPVANNNPPNIPANNPPIANNVPPNNQVLNPVPPNNPPVIPTNPPVNPPVANNNPPNTNVAVNTPPENPVNNPPPNNPPPENPPQTPPTVNNPPPANDGPSPTIRNGLAALGRGDLVGAASALRAGRNDPGAGALRSRLSSRSVSEMQNHIFSNRCAAAQQLYVRLRSAGFSAPTGSVFGDACRAP